MFQANAMTPTVTQTQYYGQQSMPKDPRAIGQKFEAIIYRMLLKEAHEDQEDLLLDSNSARQIREMQDDELSEHLGSMGRLGIADLIAEQVQARQAGLVK